MISKNQEKNIDEIYELIYKDFNNRYGKEGYVKVNQKPVKSNYRLSFGDSVEVTLPEAKEPDIVPEKFNFFVF